MHRPFPRGRRAGGLQSQGDGVAQRIEIRLTRELPVRPLRLFRFLFEHVDDEEEADPHYVDKVPVVGNNDCGRCLFVSELLDGKAATEHEQEGDEATSYVESVEPGGDVEGRAVRIARQADVLGNERCVLPDLAGDEDSSHGIGHEEPLGHAPLAHVEQRTCAAHLHTLGGKDTELAGHGREHEDDRDGRREWHVELFGLFRPQSGGRRLQREVNSEEAGEEHHLATKPNDGTDRNSVRSLDRLGSKRAVEGSCGHVSIMADNST